MLCFEKDEYISFSFGKLLKFYIMVLEDILIFYWKILFSLFNSKHFIFFSGESRSKTFDEAKVGYFFL